MQFVVHADVPPEVAFDAVADFGRIEKWDPFVRRTDVDGPPMAVGTTYSLHSLGGMTLRYRIVDIERPLRVVYEGGTRRGRSTDTITVTAVGVGAEITVASVLSFTGWVTAIAPVIRAGVWLGGRFLSLPAMRRHLAGLSVER